jgi:hypothetical protein
MNVVRAYFQVGIDHADTAALRICLHDQQLEVDHVVFDLDNVVLRQRRVRSQSRLQPDIT